MAPSAPDAVKRLVDLSACNAQADHFYQDRKVFLPGDYREEQLLRVGLTSHSSSLY